MEKVFGGEEPPTDGKVIIYTSHGPLELELWGRECPLSVRNFIQLCLEGYYDQTVFHRLVPGFVIQGGDPTGTGSGGQAALPLVPIESNMKLKWNRRGLLGMATMNDQGEAGSQFFITLSAAPELYRKSTLFGKVVGDTIYNLLQIAELPVAKGTESFERPPKILSTKVVLNPLDDIVPRELEEVRLRRKGSEEPKEGSNKNLTCNERDNKPVAVAIKNKKVLSFGDDDESNNERLVTRIKSSHEVLRDPTLSSQTVKVESFIHHPDKKTQSKEQFTKHDSLDKLQAMLSASTEEAKKKIAQVEQELIHANTIEIPKNKVSVQLTAERPDSISRFLGIRNKKAVGLLTEDPSAAFKERSRIVTGKKSRSAMDEMDTLLALNNFREKLKKTSADLPITSALSQKVEPAKRMDICKLHGLVGCESCRDTFGLKEQQDGGGEEGWLMHRLVFDREAGYRELRGDLDQLKVIDPRERTEQFANERS